MNRARLFRVSPALFLAAAFALAMNPSPSPASGWFVPVWAQVPEPFKTKLSSGSRPIVANPMSDKVLRGGLLAIAVMFSVAGSYFGLFPLMIRQQVWPLNAFAIASICAVVSFFGLLLGLFWEELRLSSGTGFVDNSPRLILIALMLAIVLAIWGHRRGQARKIRAAH